MRISGLRVGVASAHQFSRRCCERTANREAIATIARYTQNQKDRAALRRHAEMIQRDSHEGVSEELDKKDIEQRYQAVLRAL